LIDNTKRFAHDAGLVEVEVKLKHDYLDAMTNSGDPLYVELQAMLPAGTRPSDFVASAEITAHKPRKTSCC